MATVRTPKKQRRSLLDKGDQVQAPVPETSGPAAQPALPEQEPKTPPQGLIGTLDPQHIVAIKNFGRKVKYFLSWLPLFEFGLITVILVAVTSIHEQAEKEGHQKRAHSVGGTTFADIDRAEREKNKPAPPEAKIKTGSVAVTSLDNAPVYKYPELTRKGEPTNWMTIPKDSLVTVEGAIVSTGWRLVRIECTSGPHEGQSAMGYIRQDDIKQTLPGYPLVPSIEPLLQPTNWAQVHGTCPLPSPTTPVKDAKSKTQTKQPTYRQ